MSSPDLAQSSSRHRARRKRAPPRPSQDLTEPVSGSAGGVAFARVGSGPAGRQELGNLAGAALRLVRVGEMAGVFQDHELRVRDLALKAVGAGDRREEVVLAPEDQ